MLEQHKQELEKILAYQPEEGRIVKYSLSGSYLYGTNDESSDLDVRGVFVLPTYRFHEIDEPKLEIEPAEFQDTKFFEIKKFFKLCGKGSPSQLELLFSPDIRSSAYVIAKNKSIFLGKHAIYNAHIGYAKSEWATWAHSENPKALRKIRHAFRLLDQCNKLLSTGEMNPRLSDSMVEFLSNIKAGKYSWHELEETCESYKAMVEVSYNNSELPEEANWQKINELLQYIRSRN